MSQICDAQKPALSGVAGEPTKIEQVEEERKKNFNLLLLSNYCSIEKPQLLAQKNSEALTLNGVNFQAICCEPCYCFFESFFKATVGFHWTSFSSLFVSGQRLFGSSLGNGPSRLWLLKNLENFSTKTKFFFYKTGQWF